MGATFDEEKNAAWRSFLEVHSTVLRAMERELQEGQGLLLTWYDVLVHLSEAPGDRLPHQVLADSILLSRSGVTRLVDRMVVAGLVRREPCPEDRRVSYVAMTEAGAAALHRSGPDHFRSVRQHFTRHLNPEDLPVLESFFARVLQAAEDTQR